MATAFKGSGKEHIDHRKRRRFVGEARTDRERVGIVVLAGQLGDLDGVPERRADAVHLVRRHLLAVAAAAEEERRATVFERGRSGAMHVERIVDWLLARRPHVDDVDALGNQMAFHRLLEDKAGMVGAENGALLTHGSKHSGFVEETPRGTMIAMPSPLLACNWKMNPAPAGCDADGSPYRGNNVVVFPALTDLPTVREAKLVFGAQCGRSEPKGAFTGDCSMPMLKAAGCTYVLCGHSERRRYHGETDEAVIAAVIAAIEAGLHPIVCIGETQEEHDAGKTHAVLKKQLKHLPSAPRLTIAYEPVWAIGTGNTATERDIADAHACIRSVVQDPAVAILYGGSVNAQNAGAILRVPEVGGLLIGGASLKPDEFAQIVEAAKTF